MNLNIVPNGAIKRVHVSQNDVGRTLTFELFNNSTSYTIPVGATVKIQGTKPSGFGFSETCTVSGNTVTVDTTETMTDEFGYIDTELQIKYNGNTIGTSNFVLAVEKNPHPDTITDGSTETIIPELTLLVNEVKGYAEEIESTYHAYGSPWVASTVAEMTDTDKIYVYTGSETGYVNGNWYYYDGSSWVSGGVYNAVAVQTDTTLSVSGMPADAKVVGDEVSDLKGELNVSRTNNLFDPINKSGTVDGITYTFDNSKFRMNGTKTGWVVIQTISGSVGDKFSLSSMARSEKPSIYIRDGGTNIATFASADGYVTFELTSASVNISAYMSGTFDYTFSLCLVKDEIPSFPLLLREDGENTIKNFADCTYEAIGDSLTYGFTGSWDSGGQQIRVNTPYPNVVKNILGFKIAVNKGETGTTIANDLDKMGTYYPISHDSRLNGYSYAQVISVMGGTNDYTKGTKLGTVYDTQTMDTFHAGWKRILSSLVGRFSTYDSFVFVIIPPVTQVMWTDNSAGHKWIDYIDATIQECRIFGVPILDMSIMGRLCDTNESVYTSDGIHFNQKYISRIFAPMVADFIKRNCH